MTAFLFPYEGTVINSEVTQHLCGCIFQGIGHREGHVQFDKVLMGLLRRILDDNKRVQEAACSAFATLEEVFPKTNSAHNCICA